MKYLEKEKVEKVSDSNFKQHISKGVVVVKFTAKWSDKNSAYDEDVLGDNWEPVDCGQYPDDPMCSGEGDFFHEHVGNATGLALDRDDMFDIYGDRFKR